MGPGIFTKYSKQVIGGILAAFLLFGAVVLYYRFRSPVGGRSPYETVNDMYEWEYMTFTAEQERYSPDVEKIRLTFRNDAPDGVVVLSAAGSSHFGYELEFLKNGSWHQMRSHSKVCRWEGKTDIVNWNGGEVMLTCPVGKDYPSPLPVGQYRIVLPECEHLKRSHSALAVEFEVTE